MTRVGRSEEQQPGFDGLKFARHARIKALSGGDQRVIINKIKGFN